MSCVAHCIPYCFCHLQDTRKVIHKNLKEKASEYHKKQREILAQTRAIQRGQSDDDEEVSVDSDLLDEDDDDVPPPFKERASTEFFDAPEVDGD